MSRKSVLLYSDGAIYGGGERYLLELARTLPRERFLVHAVTSEEGAVDGFASDLIKTGAELTRLPAIRTLKERGKVLKLMRFFATNRPSVLHFNLVDPRACNGAMVAAWLSGRRRFVATEHLPGAPYDNGRLPFRHRIALKHTAVTIVNTEGDRVGVENRPFQRSRVVVIPNGIEDPGAPNPARRNSARAVLGFAEHEGPIVGFVGRLIPQKHADLFLEGVRRVAPHRPDVRFAILGDGPEIGALQAKVGELLLGPVVRFYGHRMDARELVYGMDLLVNTSRFEGMPFSIIEAMFAAVPTVGQKIRGVADLIAHETTGALVPPGDGDVLGQTLLQILSNTDRLRRMGATARERAITLFTSRTMSERTQAAYELIR